jgi:hypothetical protein
MVSEARHRLGLSMNAYTARVVEPLDLDQCERDLSREALVVGEMDTLGSSLSDEATKLIATAGELTGLLGERYRGRTLLHFCDRRLLAAFMAELDLRGKVGPAPSTDRLEPRPAPLAKLRRDRIVVFAAAAAHYVGLPGSGLDRS